MRAHEIMTRQVVTIASDASIVDAAKLMLDHRIGGLPVLDRNGKLIGIVSESDYLRRTEIGTQRKRPRWLQFLIGPGRAADEFVRARGRKVSQIMTPDPIVVAEDATLDELVLLMEKNGIKRLPVVQEGQLVGIVTRANLMQVVASLAGEIGDQTADDAHIRDCVARALDDVDWRPFCLWVSVRDGAVTLHGDVVDERSRQAAIVAAENVAGVREVHDHLRFIDTSFGIHHGSSNDRKISRARNVRKEAAP